MSAEWGFLCWRTRRFAVLLLTALDIISTCHHCLRFPNTMAIPYSKLYLNCPCSILKYHHSCIIQLLSIQFVWHLVFYLGNLQHPLYTKWPVLKTKAIRSYTPYRPRYKLHLPQWFPNSEYQKHSLDSFGWNNGSKRRSQYPNTVFKLSTQHNRTIIIPAQLNCTHTICVAPSLPL